MAENAHENTLEHTDPSATGDRPGLGQQLTALIALETSGRLAVHAWGALERGDLATAQRLVGAIAERATSTAAHIAGELSLADHVSRMSRTEVNPIVGWHHP